MESTMNEVNKPDEPDWDAPLIFTLTPGAIIDALFASAETVHTGWDSCVDPALVIEDKTVLDEQSENYCRLIKQAYVEDHEPDVTWNDWTVEIKMGDTYITAHWRAQEEWSPSDWNWCGSEAENAFSRACLLVGKRVRWGLIVEESSRAPRPPRTHH
jgi:hypothetical protein